MKLMITAVTAIMIKTTPVLGSSGHEAIGTGLLTLLFLGFGSFVIICQLIPGLVLFCSMLKGSLTAPQQNPHRGRKPKHPDSF